MLGKHGCKILVMSLCVSSLVACSTARPIAQAPLEEAVPVAYYDQYLDLAEQALAHKKYESAKRLLEKVFLKYPGHVQARLLVAEMQFSQGNMEMARVSFKKLVNEQGVKARALQGYGLALLTTGKADEAEIALKEAMELDPTLWRAWNGLGYYYDRNQDWQKSEFSYGQAIALEQNSSILFNNRGFSRLLQKNTDGAIIDLIQAIQLDPENTTASLNLQLALATAGRYQQAMSLSAQDVPANGMNNVGYIAFLKGDYYKAESFLTQAMETSYWFHEKAWRNLGLLRSQRQIEDEQSDKGTSERP